MLVNIAKHLEKYRKSECVVSFYDTTGSLIRLIVNTSDLTECQIKTKILTFKMCVLKNFLIITILFTSHHEGFNKISIFWNNRSEFLILFQKLK